MVNHARHGLGLAIPAEATGLREHQIRQSLSSCAGVTRASTSLLRLIEGVDGRDKPGQDDFALFDKRVVGCAYEKIFPGGPPVRNQEGQW